MLHVYTDADMTGDIDSRKSQSGYLLTFAGGTVSWQSRLQQCVALSTTKAEYIAVIESCKETFWMKIFLQKMGIKQNSYDVYCDSQNAIHLVKNSTYHSKSKYIDVRYKWIETYLSRNSCSLRKFTQRKISQI